MEPEYRKLAKYMAKHNENLVVAKMDATANDVHPMFGQLQGYPTLFFVPFTGKQEPVQYTGGEMSFKALKVTDISDFDFEDSNVRFMFRIQL